MNKLAFLSVSFFLSYDEPMRRMVRIIIFKIHRCIKIHTLCLTRTHIHTASTAVVTE